jgi:hypothetical protein
MAKKFKLLGDTAKFAHINIEGTNGEGVKVSTIQKVSVVPSGAFDFIASGDDPDIGNFEMKFTLVPIDALGNYGDVVVDGDVAAGDPDNYTIHLAKVSIILGAAALGGSPVWAHMGNCIQAKIALDDIQTKKHYNRWGASLSVDVEKVTKKGGSLTIVAEEPTADNMALVFSGDTPVTAP